MPSGFRWHNFSLRASYLPYTSWILGNMTRNARHELPKTLDFTDWLPIST